MTVKVEIVVTDRDSLIFEGEDQVDIDGQAMKAGLYIQWDDETDGEIPVQDGDGNELDGHAIVLDDDEDDQAELVVEMMEAMDQGNWEQKVERIGDYEIRVALLNLQTALNNWMDERGRSW